MRKISQKIRELETEITQLTTQLIPMEIDERHPLSREFSSQASRNGRVTELRQTLENATTDFVILLEVERGTLKPDDLASLKRTLPHIQAAYENVRRVLINHQTTIAKLERVRTLLK